MKELRVEAEKESLPVVLQFVKGELERIGCSRKDIMKLHMVVDEVFSNILSYAYEGEGSVDIAVEYYESQGIFVLSFKDEGKPFDPLCAEEPDTTLSARERKVGGLGLFMVKKTMDELHYDYRDGKNILTLKKSIGGEHV